MYGIGHVGVKYFELLILANLLRTRSLFDESISFSQLLGIQNPLLTSIHVRHNKLLINR